MKWEDTVLAAIAGYVDTLSFVALFGLFTAHVTGNFVLIGAGMAGFGQGVLMKLMAFPAFITGIVLSSLVVRRYATSPLQGAGLLYSIQAGLLAAFCAAGVGIGRAVDANAWPVVACGMLGALAMGVQNAHGRLVVRSGVPSTVMTGNVTQLILDAVDLLSQTVVADVKASARSRFAKMVPVVVAFGTGAVAGALGYRLVGFWALVPPVVGLGSLAVATWLAQRNAAARTAVAD